MTVSNSWALYYLPKDEASVYGFDCGLCITHDLVKALWRVGVATVVLNRASWREPIVSIHEPSAEPRVSRLAAALVQGALQCFRVNEDGTPFQAPSLVVQGRIDVMCSNPSCRRPNDPGYTACWWCGGRP